jgi:hypothetical protein
MSVIQDVCNSGCLVRDSPLYKMVKDTQIIILVQNSVLVTVISMSSHEIEYRISSHEYDLRYTTILDHILPISLLEVHDNFYLQNNNTVQLVAKPAFTLPVHRC